MYINVSIIIIGAIYSVLDIIWAQVLIDVILWIGVGMCVGVYVHVLDVWTLTWVLFDVNICDQAVINLTHELNPVYVTVGTF